MNETLTSKFRGRTGYLLVVVIPVLLTALYYGLLATDRYVSQARVIVERDSSRVAGLELGLLSVAQGSSALDVELVKRFIESPAMLEYLEQTLQLRAHYSQDGVDFISKLDAEASRESFFEYYLKRIEIEIDEDALTLDLGVEAFDPEFGQKLGQAIVRRAEQFVNDVGQGLAREQVAFAQGEVENANTRLFAASDELIKYQNEHELLSPELESAAVSQIIAGLQQELARQRTELKAYQSYLSRNAPEVVAARSRIQALQQQIDQERSKQVNSGKKAQALNALQSRYKELELTARVAADIYQAGLASLESAKLDASRKVKHLIMVSAPTLPESATRPRRMYVVVTVFAILNILYLIGGMILAIIEDHRE